MPAISINIPAGIANQVLTAAAQALGDNSGVQATQLATVQSYLKQQLIGLVRKNTIDLGRTTGETNAIASLPDLSTIT